jgi:pyruvate dehydrogenase E1 component alpha subunit
LQVYEETRRAVERARRGEGPTLIEAKTFRHGGHHINDPGLYMDAQKLAEWKARDPILLMRRVIAEEPAVAEIEARVDRELEAAVEFGKNSPEPSVEEFLAAISD